MGNQIDEKAFAARYDATERLCKTPTDGDGGTTTLWDWMLEGEWEVMTPEDMAAEWDSLSE